MYYVKMKKKVMSNALCSKKLAAHFNAYKISVTVIIIKLLS